MECLTSKYAAMKLLSFYIHIKTYKKYSIEKILASDPPLTYFDEHTFTEMVKKVSVSNTAIEFELINGMKLSEERTEK